jgi:hypothetical protein
VLSTLFQAQKSSRWTLTCRLGLAVFAMLWMIVSHAMAQTEAANEYQIKAVFLFNFTQFVEWPTTAFADSQEPIVIGILGDDPFGSYLDDTVRGEKVDNRALVVRRYRRAEDIDGCQILFISRSEAARTEQIIAQLKDRSILTVSDADGFGRRGGMVRFIAENSRIKLRINVVAAKAAGLTISSKLLRVAEIVGSEKAGQ